MGRGRATTHLTRVFDAASGTSSREPAQLVVEEPLEIRLDDHLVATTMRTPGHDFELAVGWCHGEGLLDGAPVESVRYCATGSAVDTGFNVVSVSTGGITPPPTGHLAAASASCGLRGPTAIAERIERVTPLEHSLRPDPAVLAALPDRLRDHRPLLDTTGAVHAAAVVSADGVPLVVREDIGRHHAVDKVVGRLLLDDRLPAGDLILVVSGRVSFEIVHKAWTAGLSVVVAASAPSALAVDTARRAGMTLAGFARGATVRFYTGPET